MFFQTYSHGFPNCPKASFVAVPLDVLDVNVGAVEGGFACGCCALDLAESSIYHAIIVGFLNSNPQSVVHNMFILFVYCSYMILSHIHVFFESNQPEE
jgi:hypothetical protein